MIPPLQWLAVNLTNGRIVCELPSLIASGAFRRTIGKYQSQTTNLIVTPDTDPAWLGATVPFTTALIAVRGNPGSEVIHWGGIVLRRQRKLGSNTVGLTLATPECYFDRRNTGPYTTDPLGVGAHTDQNTVVSDLIGDFIVAGAGIPFTVVILGGAGPTIFAQYNDYDDKTVYSVLTSLMALLNGPEWTAHWQWDRAANTITPVLYVGSRIGVPASGFGPIAIFDESNLISGELDENFTNGFGANDVTAVSSGQGLARPEATSIASSFAGRPRVQYRYQPATSIQDPLTLKQHADRALQLLEGGTNTLTLKASAEARPLLGVDWNIGDDVGYQFTGPAFPGGIEGTARAIGYESDNQSTSPVIYLPAVI